MATNPTGYGPRRAIFNGDETKYELWEVKFLAQMRLHKLYDVFVPNGEDTEPSASKKADAFAELVQCLDDRSLSLVIREARDNGQRALEVLRQQYQGKGKPRIITLYTELTTLRKSDSERTVDYVIRAETAATALRNAEEVISDALLIAMVLKGLPNDYKTFSAIVIQQEKEMTFPDFKTALRNYEENEKSRKSDSGDNVMAAKSNVESQSCSQARFEGNCFKCGKKGHRKSECWAKSGKTSKWCVNCNNKSHDTRDCRRKVDKKEHAKKAEVHKQEPEIQEDDENIEHSFAFTLNDKTCEQLGKSNNLDLACSSSLLVDTGATSHIINNKSKFVSFDKDFDPNSHVIELADGSKANVVTGKGAAKVKLYDVKGSAHDIILNNALYVPTYKQDIFSVNAAVEEGASISLDKHAKQLKSASGTVFNIEQVGRLYYLNSISSSRNSASTLAQWHRILGHCNFGDIRKLEGVVKGMKISDYNVTECKICTQGKMTQQRNRTPDRRAKAPLDMVHCDLSGPVSPVAKDGFNYALSFIDDYSGVMMVYFLKKKSDTLEASKQFLADVAPVGNVKCIRSDNGGEFVGKEFESLLRDNKIKHETCAPHSPHQNGTAERGWLTLFNMARCLLLEANLPKNMWTYAVMASAYIRNRCFNDRLGKTPFEALTGLKPNLSKMHVFGTTCLAYVQNPKKLEPRSKEGVFVGYDKRSPAYLIYYPESRRVERVRCVKFFDAENEVSLIEEEVAPVPRVLPADAEENSNTTETNCQVEEATGPSVDEEHTVRRYPTRTRNKPSYIEHVDTSVNHAVDYCYRMNNIPTCYSEAVNSPEAANWKKAMDEEVESLLDNETFTLTQPPQNREIVGGKWVYTIKTGLNDEETYKARYVAKGYSQVPGVDYHETFAPTARMSSVRILMQYAVQNDRLVHQMDVKTAYLKMVKSLFAS